MAAESTGNLLNRELTYRKKKEMEKMTREERENWILNIRNSALVISSQLGSEAVTFVLSRYGAFEPDEFADEVLSEVFNELYAIETDLK